jgi:selenocysteine-specific elongation factor
LIIGTAGHVDHGKTTLVRALTGVDTDRLAEEKRRGMTIELGFAYAGPLGFIDVPGHERLVHTMLAGAGGIDAALLVVAADDGVMPQTVEHAAILDLLGIDRGVVAITRADRAPGRVAVVMAEVEVLLAGSGLAGAAMIPVCAPAGEGVGELRDALLELGVRKRDHDGWPRLAVDRAFVISGAGTVVTGTLLTGRIAVEDRLLVSPSGIAVRVRGVRAHDQKVDLAEAGARVALNLTGVTAAEIGRGDWVVHPALHAPTAALDGRVRWLKGTRAPKADTPVHVHLAATHVTARASPLDDDMLRLTLARPVPALWGDRIVLRDAAAAATLGGAVVVDPWPPRRGGRTAARLVLLRQMEAADALPGLLALEPVPWDAHVRARNLRPDAAAALLVAHGAVLAGKMAVPAARMDDVRAMLETALADFHRAHPELPGLAADKLRAALPERVDAVLFGAALAEALRAGSIRQLAAWLHRAGHAVVLTGADEAVWARIAPAIGGEKFNPPRVRDLARALGLEEAGLRGAMRRIARVGRLVEVAQDHYFAAAAVAELAAVAAELAEGQGLTAAAFRDRLGIGRKVAIQVLEYFDGVGVTRRVGAARRMRAEA